MKVILSIPVITFLVMASLLVAEAQTTEVQYLSGRGNDDTVGWDFYCTKGNQSGKWTTIGVPSNWELQGFGSYNYGHDKNKADEEGLYRHSFSVPREWGRKKVFIVFDGSMTDTEVKVNGRLAGPVHQGAFYRFRYDITSLLKPGGRNLLEVKVSKMSANTSVNEAERTADFWVFGGIFRPVWLEAFPQEYIERVAVDARADGNFAVDVFAGNSKPGREISLQLFDNKENPAGGTFTGYLNDSGFVRISGSLSSPNTWSPEFPHLYSVKVDLKNKEVTIHSIREKIGFRTVELRKRDGIYVNGQKIRFKGVNRHSFWPSSGRTTSKKISIGDVNLMKDMNMNAVRMSHYPPDAHFLDVCDSLGLFVLDELTAWQYPPYDTEVGSKLVKEMVTRDVNHPCIVMWDNGNEGGFNFDLIPFFTKYDPQGRPIIHPWMNYGGINTQHYTPYNYGAGTYFNGREVFLPTEFSHGLYDGGHGATLDDFWNLMLSNPLSAGGFLWDFSDQGVVRTDKNGILDTGGNLGADGIVGPYREKEGSFYTIKEIWAPLFFEKKFLTPAFDGKFTIENRYHFTNLNQCTFHYELKRFDSFTEMKRMEGIIRAPDIHPGQKGVLEVLLPSGWLEYDALYITVSDPWQRKIFTWSWNISFPEELSARWIQHAGSTPAQMSETPESYILSANGVKVTISRSTGLLSEVYSRGKVIPFREGPVLIDAEYAVQDIKQSQQEDKQVVEVTCGGKHKFRLAWTLYPSGWLGLDYHYRQPGRWPILGISFSYPEDQVKSAALLANGPYRVWKNRMKGVTFNAWGKSYNNTITGESWDYPEFKGYYSNFYGIRLHSKEGEFSILSATEDLFLHLFTPDPPKGAGNSNTSPLFPGGNISFLHGIPPIGTKFQAADIMGPQGDKNIYQPNPDQPDLCGKLFFDFR